MLLKKVCYSVCNTNGILYYAMQEYNCQRYSWNEYVYIAHNFYEIVTPPASVFAEERLWNLVRIGSTLVKLYHRLFVYSSGWWLFRSTFGVVVTLVGCVSVAIELVTHRAIKLLRLTGVVHILNPCTENRLKVHTLAVPIFTQTCLKE